MPGIYIYVGNSVLQPHIPSSKDQCVGFHILRVEGIDALAWETQRSGWGDLTFGLSTGLRVEG